MRRVHIFVSGTVQAVGFRYYARSLARAFNITGFVRNTRDGRVEAEAQGDSGEIGRFIDDLRTGPSRASVSGIEVEDIPAAPGEEEFEIRA